MDQQKILVIEDDVEINSLVTKYLRKEGYEVVAAHTGLQAIDQISVNTYHLFILDIMLPYVDGFELLRRIREKNHTPVLILSAKSEDVDKIIGLGLGADDYLTKPFSIGELVARVKALIRRSFYFCNDTNQAQEEFLQYKDLQLDLSSHVAKVGNRTVSLTPTEFDILKLLMKNQSKVHTKSQIFQAVWKDHYISDENTVMVHIRRLRTKVEADPSQPEYIQTVWGIGYKLGDDC